MPDFENIELAAAVTAIRNQLTDAAAAGAAESVRFEVGPIQMEFEVELRREAGAKGGVKAWVVSADADAKVSQGRTHRVAFTLTPKDATTGHGVEIGNDSGGDTSRFGSVD
ncbi:trypco2 family protein [Streptomyces sp. NPDC046805]|uniref:trypco2 family protein n=1 Tax=Streptomyces sp. NPDC046805 TaxID=3155134 RepID=UPI0033D4CE26